MDRIIFPPKIAFTILLGSLLRILLLVIVITITEDITNFYSYDTECYQKPNSE